MSGPLLCTPEIDCSWTAGHIALFMCLLTDYLTQVIQCFVSCAVAYKGGYDHEIRETTKKVKELADSAQTSQYLGRLRVKQRTEHGKGIDIMPCETDSAWVFSATLVLNAIIV